MKRLSRFSIPNVLLAMHGVLFVALCFSRSIYGVLVLACCVFIHKRILFRVVAIAMCLIYLLVVANEFNSSNSNGFDGCDYTDRPMTLINADEFECSSSHRCASEQNDSYDDSVYTLPPVVRDGDVCGHESDSQRCNCTNTVVCHASTCFYNAYLTGGVLPDNAFT
ncbi:hypothetical protein HK407_09g14750 [Ordospora pajunii]|uniref:uncharacterized protein n=1 Tax=Ordospora pajunii TaxID=3039483 RepID=UPI0029527B27|nr:uncharacterized protein HK407_09g14750 [Ordospora pajunii]KAH9410880.1 hypothetical protein HK407_09g14750 [Ordospora pajunii]